MAFNLVVLNKYSDLVDISSYQKLKSDDWNNKVLYRGLDIKFYSQLGDLSEFYPKKIEKVKLLRSQYENYEIACKPDIREENLKFLSEKLTRLTDKYITTLKEIQFRELNQYERTPHGTVYYIDYTNGNDANDGLAANNDHSWKTINKYTTTTARTAGDIAYVRANQTHDCSAADIVMDEDGTAAAYISIIGCDATTNDPWSDDNNTLPTLDFGDAAYQMLFSGDDYWYIERLNIIQSADTAATVNIGTSDGTYFKGCNITDNSAVAGKYGVYISGSYNCFFTNCVFKDNLVANVYSSGPNEIFFRNCTFDGGVTTTDYGIDASNSIIRLEGCTFGSTTAHDTQDIRYSNIGYIKCLNCTFNKTSLLVNTANTLQYISSEDDDGTFGNQVVYYYNGTVTKDTSVTRVGGASSSAKLMPASTCGVNYPLSVSPFDDYDFKVWLEADTSKTITIYMRSVTTWGGTYPTAAQCYVTFSYLSNAATAARTTVTTNEVFSDATTWVAFDSGAIVPARSGWVYIKVYLGKYTASNGIYVDIAPVIT